MILSGVPATTPTRVWRVLLVDDDPLVCDSIRRMLEFDQCNVHSATSATEALTICDREAFDLVILDYLMPIMKGDQLALALKARYPEMPIIMITADAEKVEGAFQTPAGVDLLMAKPFQLVDLREAVKKVLAVE
jgi:CheY-like chemotaxis protein